MSEGRSAIAPFGDEAWMLELPRPPRRATIDALSALSEVADVACSERQALLWLSRGVTMSDELAAKLEAATAVSSSEPARSWSIEVVYDGEDLDEIARCVARSREAVIALHSERTYEVKATGFMPGWAYLGEVDERLRVPRRATPRPKVSAGSVAIADERTGIYPLSVPGGWNLLGTVADDFEPFDPSTGAALALGDLVRFVAVSGRPTKFRGVRARPSATRVAPELSAGQRGLRIERCEAPALVQDGGRIGAARHGVARGGALWRGMLARANQALSQPWDAPAIELYGATRIRAEGGRIRLSLDGERFTLDAGEHLEIPRATRARVRYLAVEGSVLCEPQLGGYGQLVQAGLGGIDGARTRPLSKGDLILCALEPPPQRWDEPDEPQDERCLDESFVIELVPARDAQRFAPHALERFCAEPYRSALDGGRTGVKLEGAPIPRVDRDLGASAPMVAGAIQVTASGVPIVLGVDHPTVGGYPVLALVRRAHLGPLLARKAQSVTRFALR
jgi:KipI family sensor histidine kinase inhibitor